MSTSAVEAPESNVDI